jgi:hypothetical protein
MTTQNGNPANHLFAYAVEEYDAGDGKKAKTWTRIGAAFPHRHGTGFNIQLRAFPPASRATDGPAKNLHTPMRLISGAQLSPSLSQRLRSAWMASFNALPGPDNAGTQFRVSCRRCDTQEIVRS